MKSLLKSVILAALALVIAVGVASAGSKQPTSTHKAIGLNPDGSFTFCVEPKVPGNPQTSYDIKSRCTHKGWQRFTVGKTGRAGKDGVNGTNGTNGANGKDGTNGKDGVNGTNGTNGANGKDGVNGTNGKNAPVLDAGEGRVDITRGSSTSTWGDYPTVLDSLIGGSTGGPIRFTCTAAQAPCSIAAKAAVISDSTGSEGVYVRLNISRDGTQETAPQPRYYCEYADGPLATLTKQPRTATPSFTAVPLDIGGTADCYDTPQAGGVVTAIAVPEGYYNIEAGFLFKPAATS